MQSLEEFLTDKGLSQLSQDEGCALLQVILLRSDENTVTIGYLNTQYILNKDEIRGVKDLAGPIPNPFGEGIPCQLLVSRDAELLQTRRLKVSAVLQHMPFAINRPSLVPTDVPGPLYTDKEREWFEARDIPIDIGPTLQQTTTTTTTTYTDTQSQQTTTTRTVTGRGADNPVDDTPGDGFSRDDSNRDDVNNDD